jgi:hypothetical protein
MKKHWLYGFLLCTMLTTGCGLPDAPTDLLRAPAQDVNQETIAQAVMQFLPAGAHLTVPRRPEAASAIQLQDVDGDGQEEVITFYKTDKTDYEIGVLILAQADGQWNKATAFTGVGSELDYVQFADVTGDRVAEMLLGFSGGEELNRELSVYSLKSRQPVELLKQPYSGLDVGDLNGDAVPEIALLYHDRNELRSKAELYGARNGGVEKLAEREMDGAINGYDQVLIGKATPSKTGIFVDAGIGAHYAYTILLVWENGQLVDVLQTDKREDTPTFKPYPLLSEDINQDGIIEIGIHNQPPGTDELPTVDNIPWVASYYQWDGKAGLTFQEEHYQSYEHGYDFRIPDKWTGTYTIEMKKEADTVNIQFFYMNAESGKSAELLTLKTMPRQEWSKLEASLKLQKAVYTVLNTANQAVTVAIQPTGTTELTGDDLQKYQQLLLTHDDIRKLFKRLQIPG